MCFSPPTPISGEDTAGGLARFGSRGSSSSNSITPTNRKVACVLFSPYCKVARFFFLVFLLFSKLRIPQGGLRGSVVEKVIGAMRNVVNAAQLQLAEEGELRRRWVGRSLIVIVKFVCSSASREV